MLRRAVERGVTQDRLAKALNVDISQIHKKVSLLDGICPEAVEMLKDQHFSANLGSVGVHKALGFSHAGVIESCGWKFGRWLDLTFMQLQLDERSDPDAIP